MPRETLAPALTEWLAACDRHGLEWHKPIAKEARALRAVARVMEEIHAFCPVFESCSVCRALSRLRRVSAGRARGEGAGR